MSLVLPKSSIYQFLFVLCVGVPYANSFSYEQTFAVWALCAAYTFSTKYSVAIIKQVFCYFGIISIGFLVSFSYDYKPYLIIRDITYISKPIIGLLLGYQLCKYNFKKAFQTIAYTGLIIAIIHLLVIVNAALVMHARTIEAYRLYCGYFSDFEIYVLIVLIFHEKFQLGFSKQKLRYFLLVIGVSSFLYLSRTNFIQFAILFVAMKGYLKLNRTSLLVITSMIALSIVGYSAVLYYNPKRNGPGIESFLYKVKVAPTEPFKTKIDRGNWKDFNDNYRSYENISTVKQVLGKETKQALIFGEGLGSEVDLKQKVRLGNLQMRYISILHNGFMTVFLKSGLAGVLLLIISILLFFRNGKTEVPIVKNINLMMVGTGFFMIVSCWVFMGFYFVADTKSILIGFLICYKSMAESEHYLAARE